MVTPEKLMITPEPGFETVTSPTGTEILRFSGNEIFALTRFCLFQGLKQPVLIFVCNKEEDVPPDSNLMPNVAGHQFTRAEEVIIEFLDPPNRKTWLKLVADQDSDPSGKVISYIDTGKNGFPLENYMSFRDGLLRRQIAWPTSARPTAEATP